MKTVRDQQIEAVRRFNRFYTRQIGLLREGLLDSAFSLTEARLLYELAHRHDSTAKELAEGLGLDEGYLSRILRAFKERGLIQRERSPSDGRQVLLRLTEKGEKTFAPLNARSREQAGGLLSPLSVANRNLLVEAMRAIESLMGAQVEGKVPYLLRCHQAGDMGWIVHRHGVLYSLEYGWDEQFEALVAKIVANFIRNFDPRKERCWIAEKEGEIVGSVLLVAKSKSVAQLRLLLVEPKARGLGIGTRLVSECERFARQAGYRKIVLWTNSVMRSARRIYEASGYRLVHEEPHRSFGHDLVGQTWELLLHAE